MGHLAELNNEAHLSEGHGDGLWDTRQRLGLRVVLQEDAVALENHVWLTVNRERALERFIAHCVAELAAVGRHLVATERLISTKGNSGKVFHPCDTRGKSQDTHVDCEFRLQRRLQSAAFSFDNMLRQGSMRQKDVWIDSLPLSSPLACSAEFLSHLISPEALRQDPIEDVIGNTGEGAVDHFRGASLGDAFSDSSAVGTVGEREELPVHRSSHLRGPNRCEL